MFDALTDRLSGVFDRLTGRGALSEADVDEALREVRVALLEADVALPVVKDFIAKVKAEAAGEAVIRSVKPGQQVVKIVYDGLVEMLGGDAAPEPLRIEGEPPNVIMMAGLQGSGKTTTSAKIALRLAKQRQTPRADGLARHPPPRGDGAAGDARQIHRGRRAADRCRANRRPTSPSAP